MKQSTGRLFGARLMSGQAALGIGMVAAVVAGVAACGGGNNNNCHNVPQATGLIGQPAYTGSTSNGGGAVSATGLGGIQGSPAVYTDSTGNNTVYVADYTNHRILGFKGIPAGINATAATIIVGQANATDASSGTAPEGGSPVKFTNPSKLWIATVGANTYFAVADAGNNRVLIWNQPPTSNTAPDVVLGQGAPGANSGINSGIANYPDGTVSATSLSHPTAAVISTKGQLVVVDNGNNRALIWNTVPSNSTTPPDFEVGQLATDATGNVTCTAASPYCFQSAVPNIDTFNGTTNILAVRQPSDAWTDGANLFVTDTGNNRVLYWQNVPNSMNKLPDNLIGANQFGTYTPGGGSGTQAFNAPWGVASNGNDVFVSDTGNNRLLQFKSFVVGHRNGPPATYVFGQQDFVHNTQNDPDQDGKVGDQRDSPAGTGVTAGTMSTPQGLYVSGSLNLILLADSGNNRILGFPINGTSSAGPNTAYGVDGTDTDDGNFCF